MAGAGPRLPEQSEVMCRPRQGCSPPAVALGRWPHTLAGRHHAHHAISVFLMRSLSHQTEARCSALQGPRQSHGGILPPKWWLGGEAFGRSKGGSPHERDSWPYQRDPRELPRPSHHMQEEGLPVTQEVGHQICGRRILRPAASRTGRNKCPVCGMCSPRAA